MVEYAMALPVLLLLLVGTMEGGILIFRYNTIANAAREGARTAIVPPGEACNLACVDANAVSAANALTTGLDPAALAVTLTRPGHAVQVEVTYDAVLITQPIIAAFGGGGTVQLRSVATMQRE